MDVLSLEPYLKLADIVFRPDYSFFYLIRVIYLSIESKPIGFPYFAIQTKSLLSAVSAIWRLPQSHARAALTPSIPD